MPVLEAAHIKPYADRVLILFQMLIMPPLRSDVHKLFDTGYLTVTSDLKVEISKRIKEEFENGKEYYQFHGGDLFNLPNRIQDKPANRFIDWHNENIYKG